MKDITIDELEAISVPIHSAAVRIGCTHVRVTGKIWPGGRTSGDGDDAIQLVEFSWLKAVVLEGRAIFEEDDPKRFASLLHAYGLSDEEDPPLQCESALQAAREQSEPPPLVAQKVLLSVEVSPATLHELQRQAAETGLTLGVFLDREFSHPT